MKRALCIFFFYSSFALLAQDQTKLDSLLERLPSENNDTFKVDLLNSIAWEHRNFDLETVEKYANWALKLAGVIGYHKGEVRSYFNVGNMHYIKGEYSGALENYLKALEILEQANDKESIASALMGIGNVHAIQKNYDKAIEYQERSVTIRKEIGDTLGLAGSYNNLGSIYTDLGEYIKALEYLFKSLKIKENFGQWKSLSSSYGNIGGIYKRMENYPKAMEYQLKALEIRKKINNKKGMVMSYTDIGSIYSAQNQHSKALESQKKALTMAKEMGFGEGIKNSLHAISQSYETQGNLHSAFSYYKQYVELKDSLFTIDKSAEIAELEALFQNEKDVKKIAILEKDSEIQELQLQKQTKSIFRQRLYIVLGAMTLLLVCSLLYILYKRYQYKQRLNEHLGARNKRIIEQNEIILDKNQQTTDSIRYASRIQEGVLPNQEALTGCFSNIFSIYWPRDIVSGDFYWSHKIGDISLLAVVDCTGHGVPGSLLSMLGQNVLNQVVIENKIYDPGEVLSELNRRIIGSLKQKSGSDLNEGMDISIVKFDHKKRELTFAGAMNSMAYISNGEIVEIPADRKSIGGITPMDYKFTNQNVPVDNQSTYYLFTDGYVDQFGGDNGKKMKMSKFKALLTSIVNKPFESQQREIEKYFKEWQGNYTQVDDVCIIGFQV